MIYGYARISHHSQKIERQISNLERFNEKIIITQEAYTGTKGSRPKWDLLKRKLVKGDTLVFDSVSRMSRNSEEGVKQYFELLDLGIKLIFLKERYIDSDVYQSRIESAKGVRSDGMEDLILNGVREYMKELAKQQIKIAFDQSEKEVEDLRQRTREGIREARLRGKQIGAVPGKKLITKKSIVMKEKLKKLAKRFGGVHSNEETIELLGISRNTYYKYLRELEKNEGGEDGN